MTPILIGLALAATGTSTSAFNQAATVYQPVVELSTTSPYTASSTTLESYVREYYKDTPVLAEIARCESHFTQYTDRGNILRGREVSTDVGVMQINETYHAAAARRMGYDIYTLQGNLAYAQAIYEKSGAAPWTASASCWGKALRGYELARR